MPRAPASWPRSWPRSCRAVPPASRKTTSSALLFAVVTATVFANRRIIGRPLALLMASIQRSHLTGERRAVQWSSEDEIGRVVVAFNEMQERQTAYETELRATNDALETRVAARTAELASAEATAQEARKQLADAIESITEGFALYDADDHLIVANRRYREIILGDARGEMPAGSTYLDVVKKAAASGRFPGAKADPEQWIGRQIDRFRGGAQSHI